MTTTTTTPALAALRKAAAKYARANAARKAALDDLLEAVRAADAEGGHSRQALVAEAGIAKQTVYNVLDAKDAK
jgi:hypothetical protein